MNSNDEGLLSNSAKGNASRYVMHSLSHHASPSTNATNATNANGATATTADVGTPLSPLPSPNANARQTTASDSAQTARWLMRMLRWVQAMILLIVVTESSTQMVDLKVATTEIVTRCVTDSALAVAQAIVLAAFGRTPRAPAISRTRTQAQLPALKSAR